MKKSQISSSECVTTERIDRCSSTHHLALDETGTPILRPFHDHRFTGSRSRPRL